MTRRFSILLVAALLAVSGCGGNGTLSDDAAADLEQRAAAVRAAAESRDVDAAEQELAALRAALDAHVEADAVSPGRAREIAAAADAVEARLPSLVEDEAEPPPEEQAPPTTEPPTTTQPPTTEPPTTTQPPTTAPDPDDDRDDDDRDDDDRDDDDDDQGGGDGRGPDGEGPPGQSRPDDGGVGRLGRVADHG